MAIGLVSDDDFFKELGIIQEQIRTSTEPIPISLPEVIPEVVPSESHGRKPGDVNVPDSLRKIIGEEAVINGRQAALQLAADFGVSASSASAYAKGATSTTKYNEPKKDIVEYLNASRRRATKKASKTLNAALSSITQEKLDFTDAKDLSDIAKSMSVVIKNLEPQYLPSNDGGTVTPQFVIFAPQFKSEKSYEVIEVKE